VQAEFDEADRGAGTEIDVVPLNPQRQTAERYSSADPTANRRVFFGLDGISQEPCRNGLTVGVTGRGERMRASDPGPTAKLGWSSIRSLRRSKRPMRLGKQTGHDIEAPGGPGTTESTPC